MDRSGQRMSAVVSIPTVDPRSDRRFDSCGPPLTVSHTTTLRSSPFATRPGLRVDRDLVGSAQGDGVTESELVSKVGNEEV